MPKFDASSIGDVEYDFTGWNGIRGSRYAGIPIDDKGAVPEPSRELVSTTMKRVNDAFQATELHDKAAETPEAIAAALQKINDEDTFKLLGDELMDAVSELCDGSPRRESLESLGWRRFMAFFGYVMGELMSPEVESGATKSTQTRLKSV
jgi:hypothetical protein